MKLVPLALLICIPCLAQRPPQPAEVVPVDKPIGVVAAPSIPQEGAPRWWKGNLHTHSLWSDGNDYPEMIFDWYKTRGYNFLMLSDHNTLAEGERWFPVTDARGGGEFLTRYVQRFGEEWVERKTEDGKALVRLKTLKEYRPLFEEPGRFTVLQGEEVTDAFERKPIHINVTNLAELIRPQHGTSVLDTMQRNIDAVLEQRRVSKRPMFPHVNHPNFGWAVTAEELMQLRGERFFEVWNGHPSVRNDGDRDHVGTERMWDICNAHRLGELKLPLLFGLGTDDSHHYDVYERGKSNPGRAWVVVRAHELEASSLVHALEAGDFYASTGVVLRDVRCDGREITVEVQAEPGVRYRIDFIGTTEDFDRASEERTNLQGKPLAVTRKYSEDIGRRLGSTPSATGKYRFRGDELYVRAKITSTKPKDNPYRVGEQEVAWTQPLRPGDTLPPR